MAEKQLTLRGVLTGILGLVVITASSMYVALRMGALPWPTVFVTVLSMTVLGRCKGSTLQEINVTHTLMSAGAMVSGGLAFTIPGIWMIDPNANVSVLALMIMAICGALLGTVCSAVYRRNLIEEQKLVYPIGQASYQTLVTGINNGKESFKLFISMGASVVFTALRDALGWIPAVLTLFKGSALVQPITIWISPMALAIGAMIGKVSSFLWLGGAILGYLLIVPIGLATSLFADTFSANLFRENLGIGIMLGTGIGVFLKASIDAIKKKDSKAVNSQKSVASSLKTKKGVTLCLLIGAFSVLLLTLFTNMSLPTAIVAVLGVCLTTLLSGILTGQSGVNPMEVFGILVMLLVQVSFNPSLLVLFMVAGLVAVACGLSGDVMNDLKSGYMLKTDPKQQIIGEAIGGVVGAVVSVFVLFLMKKSFGSFGTSVLPAPQAKAVASMASGIGSSPAFFFGVVLGAVLYLLGVPAATLGLGIYLSINISLIVGLGAFVALVLSRSKKIKANDISLVSSGLLGGEGITGVVIAIVSMFS